MSHSHTGTQVYHSLTVLLEYHGTYIYRALCMGHSEYFRTRALIHCTHTDACTPPYVLSPFVSLYLSSFLCISLLLFLLLFLLLYFSPSFSHRPTFNGSHRSGVGLIEGVRPPSTSDLRLPVFRSVHPGFERQLIVPLRVESDERKIGKKTRNEKPYGEGNVCVYVCVSYTYCISLLKYILCVTQYCTRINTTCDTEV